MHRIDKGKYRVEINGDVFEVTKDIQRVPTGKSGKGTFLETWTPMKNGDQRPFEGRSYPNYRGAREAVYAHIEENYSDASFT